MNDYKILKATFKSIGCGFTSSQTLFGFIVNVQTSSETCTNWEFDSTGKFIRVFNGKEERNKARTEA